MENAPEPSHWVHDLDPFLIEFWNGFGIRWYGLAYIAGFLFGIWFLRLCVKKRRSPLNMDQQYTAEAALILAVLVGARLGFELLYNLNGMLHNPLEIVKVWEGGMSSHGGFVAVILAIIWIGWRFQVSPFQFGDLMVPLAPFGLMCGRLANFINGELYGKVSEVPWAIIFPKSSALPVHLIAPRHPSQLYEAALEGLLPLIYVQWRFWKTDVQQYPGRLGGEFLILYSIGRIAAEQFREPDASLIFGMSRGIFYSIFLIGFGLWLIGRSYAKGPQSLPTPPAPEPADKPPKRKQKKGQP